MTEETNYNDRQLAEVLAFDENNDGELDNIVGYKRDGLQRVVEVYLDYDGDGIADSKIFFEYDNFSRIIKKYMDKNLDGKIDATETYEYDANGNKTTYYDDNADGKVDYIETVDDDGNAYIEDVRDLKQKLKESINDLLKRK